AESSQVRATFPRVDVVREREQVLLVAVVVLKRDLDLDPVLLALEEEHLGMDRCLVLVQVLDELDDAALVEEAVAALVALILDRDLEALVQEGQLAQAIGQGVERERGLLEDLPVRLEAHDRAVLRRLLASPQLALRHAVLVALRPDVAASADLDLEPLAQSVDDRDSDAMQPAGHLIGRVFELASGVQHGQDDLGRRAPAFLVNVYGNPAPVIADRTGPVAVQDDLEAVTIAGQRLVHGVVDCFIAQMMESISAGVADVHRRALADGLQALEHLDVARRVSFRAHAAPLTAAKSMLRTRPPFTSHRTAPL